MAGTYIEGISKVLSGVYTLIKAAVAGVVKGTRGIVAYAFTSDWGPINSLIENSIDSDFKNRYNADKTDLTAAKVYKHAYLGKPYKILGFRMATAAAAKGSCVLKDAGSVMSLTLETLYPSARLFQAVVTDNLAGGKVITIKENGIELMEVEGGTVVDLEAKLNLSNFVRVTSKGANLPANNAGQAFVGGNNGDVVTAVEYQAFLDVLEADGTANAFALDAVVDEAILTTVDTFIRRVRSEGFYVTFIRGGSNTWDQAGGVDLANAKSKAINYRGTINVGNGCDDVTAAELAIYVAARVASVPLNKTLTDEVTPYKAVNRKLKKDERTACKEAGTLIFVQVGNSIMIDEGVNTLTVPTADENIYYGKIRVSNVLDAISKDLEAFGEAYKREKSNTPEARELYAAAVEDEYLGPMANMEVIKPGYYYVPDPEYHGKDAIYTPKIDEAFFIGDITPVDSMERVYQKIGVHF